MKSKIITGYLLQSCIQTVFGSTQLFTGMPDQSILGKCEDLNPWLKPENIDINK